MTMSTNPATKAYWKRIARLAQRLQLEAAWQWGKDLSLVIDESEPTMPRTMQLKAIDQAILVCADDLEHLQREIEDTKAAATKLRKFKADVFRGPLRIIESGCGKVRDGSI